MTHLCSKSHHVKVAAAVAEAEEAFVPGVAAVDEATGLRWRIVDVVRQKHYKFYMGKLIELTERLEQLRLEILKRKAVEAEQRRANAASVEDDEAAMLAAAFGATQRGLISSGISLRALKPSEPPSPHHPQPTKPNQSNQDLVQNPRTRVITSQTLPTDVFGHF